MRDKQVERSLSQVSEQVWQSWQNAPVSNLGLDFDSAISRDYAYGADGADGADGAAFQLVEFVDFECPACRMAYREFKKLAQKFDGQLQIVLKNYPLDNSCNPSMPRPLHASACFLASVSRCAGEQGKFWEVTDYLFELPIVEAEASFEEVRSEAFKAVELFELDEQALRECLGSPRVLAKLHSDIELGNQLGLRGTPSLWLNGKKLEVSHPEVVESLIKRAMRQ
jgi:protein-disulfide isomerase